MFDHDDSVAAARFRDAVNSEPAHAEEEAASESGGATTYDFTRYRARRIRERLIVLLDTLAARLSCSRLTRSTTFVCSGSRASAMASFFPFAFALMIA